MLLDIAVIALGLVSVWLARWYHPHWIEAVAVRVDSRGGDGQRIRDRLTRPGIRAMFRATEIAGYVIVVAGVVLVAVG